MVQLLKVLNSKATDGKFCRIFIYETYVKFRFFSTIADYDENYTEKVIVKSSFIKSYKLEDFIDSNQLEFQIVKEEFYKYVVV